MTIKKEKTKGYNILVKTQYGNKNIYVEKKKDIKRRIITAFKELEIKAITKKRPP